MLSLKRLCRRHQAWEGKYVLSPRQKTSDPQMTVFGTREFGRRLDEEFLAHTVLAAFFERVHLATSPYPRPLSSPEAEAMREWSDDSLSYSLSNFFFAFLRVIFLSVYSF